MDNNLVEKTMKRSELKELIVEILTEVTDGYTTTMIRDAKNQKGVTLSKGEKVIVVFPKNRADVTHIFSANDPKRSNILMVRTMNLNKYVKGATKEPSEKLLYKMSDGIAKSVLGKRVEPDGYDQYGSPSWLLVAGLI